MLLVDSFVTIFLMLFLEPLLLWRFGATPGKAIFGLRISSFDGGRLPYIDGLARTWGVIGEGVGYYIPIFNLVRLWKSYKLCKEKTMQRWEEYSAYTIEDTRWYRGAAYTGACAVLVALTVVIIAAQRIPPNRGELTVREFAENFNYYAEYYGVQFGGKLLDETGCWREKTPDDTIYIDFFNRQTPEYVFQINDGIVEGVSFSVEINDTNGNLEHFDLIASYETQMQIASLAFICAQKDVLLFSSVPRRITEMLSENAFSDFKHTEAGITLVGNTDYIGYTGPMSGVLIPEEGSKLRSFSLSFMMSK